MVIRIQEEDPETRVLQELYSMILNLLRSPPPITLPLPPIHSPETPSSSSQFRPNTTSFRVSPAAFASLFLGISLALMLFGSIIFLIGFILMPWIVGLVLVFYFAGMLSSVSGLGRAFLSWTFSPQHNNNNHCLQQVLSMLFVVFVSSYVSMGVFYHLSAPFMRNEKLEWVPIINDKCLFP